MTRSWLALFTLVIALVGGCAASSASRQAKPYALILPGGEPVPDPLPAETYVMELESPPPSPSLDPVRGRIDRARRLYRDLAFVASLEELDRAQAGAEASVDAEDALLLLDQISLLRAMNHLALGNSTEALLGFRQAAILRPERDSLDPAEFSPDVRAGYEEARRTLRTEAPRAVHVDSTPTASVSSDGEPVGSTPLSLGLHRGRHYLLFVAPRHRPASRVLSIETDTEHTLVVDLEMLRPGQIAGQLARLDALALAALPSSERSGLVPPERATPVHVGKYDGGWRAALIDPSTGDIVRTARVSDMTLDLAVPELVTSLRDAPSTKPLVRKWWFWTVIGVAVVATSLGLYFGLRKQPEPQLVIRPATP